MSTEYIKAHQKYRALVKAAAGGDAVARADKSKAMNEIRAIEREAARAGTILSATYAPGDKVDVQTRQTDSKRSLQEEYVRKFDGDTVVSVPERPGQEAKEQTLREFHRKRLLWR